MDIEKTGIQKTGIETTDIEKVDIEKGEFEEPVDWATARWTKERIQSRLLSYTLVRFLTTTTDNTLLTQYLQALCSIAILALIFQPRYTPSDTRDQTPNPQGTIPSYAIDYGSSPHSSPHNSPF